MVECVQGAGEMIYVPPGWWHAVLNVPLETESITVCCTQNSLTPAMLKTDGWSWNEMKRRWPQLGKRIHSRLQSKGDAAGLSEVSTEELKHGEEGDLQPTAEDVIEKTPDSGNMQIDDEWALVIDERRRMLESQAGDRRASSAAEELESWDLERREASGLSLKEMRESYIRRRKLVLVSGMSPSCVPCPRGLSAWGYLKEMFGSKRVAVHKGASQGGPDFRGGDRMGLMLLGELIDLIERGEADGMYLYDCPIADKLPQLLEQWRIPRYFGHCYLQQTMRSHTNKTSWPTLFSGAAGTGSPTHIDRWQGHFWMLQIEGKKKWTVWHPDDLCLLSPSFPNGKYDPCFPSAKILNDSEDARYTRKVELELTPGDLLFVPAGSPHAVENLTDSVAIGGNFVDESNLEQVLAELKLLSQRYPDASQLAEALEDMAFEPNAGLVEAHLSVEDLGLEYSEFSSGAAAAWRPR